MLRAPLRSSSAAARAVAARPLRPAVAASSSLNAGKRIFCSTTKENVSKSAKIPLSVGIASGGVAGMISALTGVGGGIILIPTLAKFTTLPQQAINGTSIGAVTLSASIGAWNHFESGACNYPLAFMTTIPAIICTRYGVATAQRLSSKRLSFVVGSAMLACSPLIFLKNSPHFPKLNTGDQDPLDLQFYGQPLKEGQTVPYIERVERDIPGFAIANAKYLVAGAFAGFISGLCGLGGGILMTAYLTAASDMPQEHIIGTSLLSIVPTAASSTYFNIKAKSIHIPTAIRVGGALAVGVYVTSKYVTHSVPEDVLRGILGTTLSAAAIVMMRRSL
uniref:Membrane transporter protein n=1 Tax=Globisporangium ultimum (strain ATCC 200006 / CBS 805.95 / DAOM BR144) TaxID=431595 RepID=K3XA65_GLOUD